MYLIGHGIAFCCAGIATGSTDTARLKDNTTEGNRCSSSLHCSIHLCFASPWSECVLQGADLQGVVVAEPGSQVEAADDRTLLLSLTAVLHWEMVCTHHLQAQC